MFFSFFIETAPENREAIFQARSITYNAICVKVLKNTTRLFSYSTILSFISIFEKLRIVLIDLLGQFKTDFNLIYVIFPLFHIYTSCFLQRFLFRKHRRITNRKATPDETFSHSIKLHIMGRIKCVKPLNLLVENTFRHLTIPVEASRDDQSN